MKTAPAAQAYEHLVALVGEIDDVLPAAQQRLAGAVWVTEPQYLHLCAHQWSGARCFETAALACELGHEGGCGDDRWLLHCHGHEHVFAVELEIAGHA